MARQTTYHDSVKVTELDSVTGYREFSADGSVTTQRALTADEAAQLAAQDTAEVQANNSAALRQQAAAALAGNRTYVALASPTAAQTTAQVKALCRQVNGVIRLVLDQFDGTD